MAGPQPRGAPAVFRGGWGWRWRRAPLLALACPLALACAESASPADAAPDAAPFPPFVVLGRWDDAGGLAWFADASAGPLEPGEFRAGIADALAAWSDAGPVGFVAAADRAAADVVFRWGTSGAERDGGRFARDTSVALTGPVGPGCEVVFDAAQAWREAGGDGPSFRRAALHEVGHVLGLGHVELPGSALHPQWQVAAGEPGEADLAGLHSLYGGGDERAGDLVVERRDAGGETRELLALRRVAPPGRTEWALFDTDGDGDEEVVVWDVGASGLGGLVAYHFAPGPRLARTVGPWLGVAGSGARLRFVADAPDGRCVYATADGRTVRWTLDAAGVPGEPRPHGHEVEPAEASDLLIGDLDGDDRPERVRRVLRP